MYRGDNFSATEVPGEQLLGGTNFRVTSPVLICIVALPLVFTAYLSNAVVSGKLPFYFSGARSSEAAGITNRPSRSPVVPE